MTVRVITDGPDPLLATRMSRYPTYVVPPKHVNQVGKDEFARKPVGTGPYKFVEFVPDQHVILEANADYWRGKPEIDRVVWRPIPDATARVTALITGEVQPIESVPADLAKLVSENDDRPRQSRQWWAHHLSGPQVECGSTRQSQGPPGTQYGH